MLFSCGFFVVGCLYEGCTCSGNPSFRTLFIGGIPMLSSMNIFEQLPGGPAPEQAARLIRSSTMPTPTPDDSVLRRPDPLRRCRVAVLNSN